jgi:hypothetical protein
MVFDPFSGKVVLFGAGKVGAIDPATPGVYSESAMLWTDFDQGAVDGLGHAFVAGGGGITFIDYSISGDITTPDYVTTITGFTNIDDLAPLIGAGGGGGPVVPVPPAVVMAVTGGIGLLGFRRRQRKPAA